MFNKHLLAALGACLAAISPALAGGPIAPPYQNAVGKPFGLVQADINGAEPRAEDQRAPQQFDDWTEGYSAGDGVNNYGPIWYWAGLEWQLTNRTNTYNQSDWFRTGAPLPCDPGAMSVPCGVYYGTVKGVSAYAGNVGTLWRASDQTTLAVPFIAQGGQLVADQKQMNRFCYNAPFTQRCFWSVINDQTSGANNLTPKWTGAVSASTAPTVQSGTFTKNSVITMADTGGTCTQPTQISVDTVSGGTILTSHISQYSRCTAIATNGTQASASVTGGGTSASFTMIYGYPEAAEYLPYISINGLPAITCGSMGANQGPDLINQQHACTMVTGTTAWSPHNTTWAGVMTQKSAQGPAQFLRTTDNVYGWNLATATLTPGPVGLNGTSCTTVNPLSTPSVVVLSAQTGTVVCFENNEFQALTGFKTTSEAATGFTLGSGNSSNFTFTSLFDAPAATSADINIMRLGLTSMGQVQSQIRTQIDVGGASMTYGAGQGDGQNYTTSGNFPYRRGVTEVNQALPSNPMCTEDATFLTAGVGDSLMYNPYASVNIALNVGEMNDVGSSSAATIHGCRAHLMYQWEQLATGYFLVAVNLVTPTGVSGYANNDTITLTPPSGITCSVTPVVKVLATGSAGAGVPGSASIMATPGWCTGAAASSGTWTQASTSGAGTGATFTAQSLPRSPVIYVSGETPPQCQKWGQQGTINVIFGQYNDLVANLNTLQPAGGCTTASACTAVTGGYAGGAGLRPAGMTTTGFNDYASDPIVGFGGPTGNVSFPGPFLSQSAGTLYPAGNYPSATGTPTAPFCLNINSGTGDHENAFSSLLMGGNLTVTINSVLGYP